MNAPTDPNATTDDAPRRDSFPDAAAVPLAAPAVSAEARLDLQEEIARGGMGAVFRARDIALGRDVAVKVLLESHHDRPALERRFLEEARIASRLQHPGVAPIYALGRLPDGRPFFAMKLIEGRTLAALLAERPDPSADRPRFLAAFERVCQTVAYAHSRGVLHRDLKPLNVMVGGFGEVQVMDWGLAKVLSHAGEAAGPSGLQTEQGGGSDTGSDFSETRAGSVLGTPAYMAPEQARGEVEDVGVRSDVFGLGAILCEVLTGRPPFAGPSEAALKRARRAELGDALGRLDGCGADAELIDLTKRCLAADPAGRPRDAGEVSAAVTAYRESVERRLRAAEVANAEARTKAAEGRKRRRLAGALAAVLLLTATAGGGVWGWVAWDRAVRRAAAERVADAALDKAAQAAEQAKAIDRSADERGREEPETPEAAKQALALWHQAQTAVEEADRALTADAGKEARGRLAARRAEVEAGLARAEREARLLNDLDQARALRATWRGSGFDRESAARSYAAALAAYGAGAAGAEEQVSAAIRAERPAVRLAMIVALDDWATISASRPEATRLLGVADKADDDAWRRRYRAAALAGDFGALPRLAMEARGQELPAVSADALAIALIMGGAPADAAAVLRQARLQHPADFWVHYILGGCLSADAHPDPATLDEAAGALWAAIALRPDNAPARTDLGYVLCDQGDRDGAAVCFRKATELDPRLANARSGLGLVLYAQGDRDEAAVCFRKAAELDPRLAIARRGLGHVLYAQGDRDGAAVCFRKAIELDPKDAEAYCMLGHILRAKGDLAGAAVCLRIAIELDPKFAVAHNTLGVVLQDKGDLAGAAAFFQKAIQLDPKFAVAHNNLGMVLRDQGKLDEAVAEFREAVRLDPHFADASANLAGAEKMVALQEKLPALQKGEFKPRTSDELNAMAGLCRIKGLFLATAQMYQAVFADDPKLADDPKTGNRYNAACYATLAAAGRGKDEPPPDETKKAELRRQALAWLRADLDLWAKQLQSDKPEDQKTAVQMLRHWQEDADLSGLRDPAELAKLPADEREACQKLWADVQALLEKAEAKKQ